MNQQPIRGAFALASGGWWGLGLGASEQKWGMLAGSHTDFIFAIIGEELGLMGTLVVIGLFVVLSYAGFQVALRSDDRFARLASAGITAWFAIQALVNVAVVLRLLPVFGVPLPFISYGGSALLANLAALRDSSQLRAARTRGPRLADTKAGRATIAWASEHRGATTRTIGGHHDACRSGRRWNGRSHIAADRDRAALVDIQSDVELTAVGTVKGLESRVHSGRRTAPGLDPRRSHSRGG